jgi:galactokinase
LIDTRRLRETFDALYGRASELASAPQFFRAPGRVNLIGEHTDYNEGFVLPMAIDYETVVAAAPREDARIRVFSVNENESYEFDLNAPSGGRRRIWLDYIEGVAQGLRARGFQIQGANLALVSNVPIGAGLSSSAALEVSVGFALVALSGVEIDTNTRKQIALAGQFAEHNYVGTKSGIMDQFIAALGEKNHALLIDCRTQDARPVPLKIDDCAIVVCNSHVKHDLAASEYNTRRAECEKGVEILRQFLPDIQALRDVNLEEFRRYEIHLPEIIRRRCRHVVSEDARTLRAVEDLRAGRLKEFGRLMYASHESLRDDYAVSCAELDLLVALASQTDGVLGARMTGGGFGGCTVNLVERARISEFERFVGEGYERAFALKPDFYVCSAAAGAQQISAA